MGKIVIDLWDVAWFVSGAVIGSGCWTAMIQYTPGWFQQLIVAADQILDEATDEVD